MVSDGEGERRDWGQAHWRGWRRVHNVLHGGQSPLAARDEPGWIERGALSIRFRGDEDDNILTEWWM